MNDKIQAARDRWADAWAIDNHEADLLPSHNESYAAGFDRGVEIGRLEGAQAALKDVQANVAMVISELGNRLEKGLEGK